MCYTGKCKYEDHMGECILKQERDAPYYPDDAACVRMELELEEDEKGEIE